MMYLIIFLLFISLERIGGFQITVGITCSPSNIINRKTSQHDQQVSYNVRPHITKLQFFKFGGDNDDKKQEPIKPTTMTTNDDKDPVEKIFSFFFGEPEAEPLGLKRFGKDRFPEQYPAITNEWADPLVGDTPDVAQFRPILKNTNFEFRKLRVTYDANKHGWDSTVFHKKVDKLGPGLVVATTTSGLVVGGYNPKGWVGYGEARGSIAAFLFRSKIPNSTEEWIKLRKVGGASMAQMDNPESGPMFGADSLIIPLQRGANSKVARSKLGSYYERMDNGSTNSLFGKDTPTVLLRDLKVYHGVYEPDEYIPFTDAEPLALY
jgi:TLD